MCFWYLGTSHPCSVCMHQVHVSTCPREKDLLVYSMMASGSDTGEVGSSSQILASTSIKPGTANKQPRSTIWLYFKDVTWSSRNIVLHCTDLYTHNWAQQCNTKGQERTNLTSKYGHLLCWPWRTLLTPQPTRQKVLLHSRYLRTYLLKGYFLSGESLFWHVNMFSFLNQTGVVVCT